MRSFLALCALTLSATATASSAPFGPVTLVGEYCGFGPCLPITATLNADHTCRFDFIGDGRWEYDKRRQELRIYAASSIVLSLSSDNRCGKGLVDLSPRGLPSEKIEMCVFSAP